jgi:predicted metal-dependent phosphotriesterase family hydrolase
MKTTIPLDRAVSILADGIRSDLESALRNRIQTHMDVIVYEAAQQLRAQLKAHIVSYTGIDPEKVVVELHLDLKKS